MGFAPVSRTFVPVLAAAAISAAACGATQAVEDIPAGTEVTITLQDGEVVRGRLMDVRQDALVVEQSSTGDAREIGRAAVVDVNQPRASSEPSLADRIFSREPEFVEVEVPAGTVIAGRLETALASNANRREDVVRAALAEPLVVDGRHVFPAGSELVGTVTSAEASGRVKGQAHLAFRFDRVRTGSDAYDVTTAPLSFTADPTKKEDALKIGAGAAAGTIIGGLAGGGRGAAVGAAVGGGAGTAVVLATPGDEVRLTSGTALRVELTSPVTVRVPRSPE